MIEGNEVRDGRQATVVERILEYIDQKYAEQLSLRDVARAFDYSPCHLTTLFSQNMGMPITAWIIKRRILAAQDLLAERNMSIDKTCVAVGFNDPCYFTRQFVRYVGTTPGRFRSAMNASRSVESADMGHSPDEDRPAP